MDVTAQKKASIGLVITAFAIVFIVWGSTYFFIGIAVKGFPPMLMGAVRYLSAGFLLLAWCGLKGDRVRIKKELISAAISGLLMLFVATGIVIWVEITLPSALVAILVSANPIWFIILDKANWRTNLKTKTTVYGLLIGFAGILLLFGESLLHSFSGRLDGSVLRGLLLLMISPIAWSAGSLYAKKHASQAPARVNTAWQMIIAGFAFLPAGLIHREFDSFTLSSVPLQSWLAITYLIVFGSIGAFSAYIWLLQVRPATQVSIHSYVNPVIAVLLGVGFANESITGLQVIGLFVILFSVLLVNLPKYAPPSLKKPIWIRPQILKQ
ncbi:EamA family transporter [Larkinella terrae]|uniref:EamA family transporter n=1 Tax=Larkinella terrae TaxID=2025311 RepID=A0A7K0EUW8_9BACT|nr:EamA family transporter [Larkinella terrae]MRS65607.1 EamA family transporter [Larkinella terrae]